MPSASLSEASISNLALGLVGQRNFLIDSLEEKTTEAIVAKTYFAATRDELLAGYPWRFAMARQVLALTQQSRSEWGFAYAAPADMLVARFVSNGSGKRLFGRGQQVPFDKELNDTRDGWLILTDMEAATLFYTAGLTTVALFPPHFVTALAAQLAVAFAGALPVKPQLLPMLQQAAMQKLLTAQAIDATEAVADEESDSETIRIRG